jgi:two-component system, OmpR family, sensor histidine kinase KdpD
MTIDPTDQNVRPSPDALLKRAEQEARGQLKIFVGAAPGVGKTYAMLEAARARDKDGVDVIVGIVETHGRKETEALLDGLEVIPRRRTLYKERWLEEMDLDAIILRRPQLVLVDELAHTNAPESRHPKRFLDVDELLGLGIDVYTTINIQHIESLNDVVAQITGVRVRETVPDSTFDRANAVELVDLTPDDLIQRLKDGKVYVPEQAERALGRFFSPANLTALRELALRRTAERVDEQLLNEMQARAIPGPWAAGERLLICVNEDPRSSGLVRYTKRLSDRLHAPWTALYVESRRSVQLGEDEQDRIAAALRLAQSLGGEPVTIPSAAPNIAHDVITYARATNISQIVIGKSHRSRWFEILHGSVVHDLVRLAGNISVHVIAGNEMLAEVTASPAIAVTERPATLNLRAYGFSLASALIAVGIGKLLWPWIGTENIGLVFLTGIVGIAVRFGLWPSLFASLMSAIAYNFFFTEPYYTLRVSDPKSVLAILFFTVVAVIVSNVAAQARIQAVSAMRRVRTTESLYGFSRKLSSAGTLDDLLWATAYQTALMLKVRVVILLKSSDGIALKAGYPPEDVLDEADFAAAEWAYANDRAAGRDSDTLPGAKRLFLPMRTGRGILGVVGIDRDRPGVLFSPDERRLLDALIYQSALAIERVHLVEEMDRAQRVVETERLRSALLTSISHDLRTPLASVIGSAAALRDLSPKLSDAEKADLLATIIDESERLNRFIANLLDMTKLESGAITPKLTPHDLGDIIGSTLRRAEKMLSAHKVELDLSTDLPMINVDAVLFEQALFNLLDNAAKYAPAGTMITLRARRMNDDLRIQILDEGRGIPPSELESIFGKFYRTRKSDQIPAGTGLGLVISRGFIEAMHGTLTAANRSEKSGAVFTIVMPIAANATKLESAA